MLMVRELNKNFKQQSIVDIIGINTYRKVIIIFKTI